MNKYLSALVLGGLFCCASLAYAVDKPVIDSINQPAVEVQGPEQMVTKSEFNAMLTQSAGTYVDIDQLIDDNFSVDEPINFAEAIDICTLVANPFANGDKDTIDLAHELNLINKEWNETKSSALLTPEDAKIMLDNLATFLNLEQNDKNNLGVSYTLTPLKDEYKLELLWGKKPSSGYNIKIAETKTVGDTLYVKYVTSEPKPGAAYLTVITNPSDSVVIEAKKPPKRVVMVN